jgi:hypothetical protein
MAVPAASEAPMESEPKVPPVHAGDTSSTVTVTGCRESGTRNPKILVAACPTTAVEPAATSSTATDSAHTSKEASQAGEPPQTLRQSMRK